MRFSEMKVLARIYLASGRAPQMTERTVSNWFKSERAAKAWISKAITSGLAYDGRIIHKEGF